MSMSRVTAPIAFGRLYMSTALIGFLNRYPEVNVEYGLTDRMVDLVEEGVDVGIRIGRLPDSTLVARRLAPMHRRIYASPAYIERHGAPRSPSELVAHNCLTFRLAEAGNLWRPGGDVWHLEGPEGAFEVPVSGTLKASSAEVLVRAALAGLGLILVLDWLVSERLADGQLVQVLDDYEVSHYQGDAIYAVYPSGRYVSAKVRAFVDYSVDYFAQLEAPNGR